MFSNAKAWKTQMAPNCLLSYSSGLCKSKIRYNTLSVTLYYNINSIHQIKIHLQINQAIQMFEYIFMKVLGKIITTQMTIHNKKDYIVLYFTTIFNFNTLSNTYKNVISFSTSYGNWWRPWPVQFIWTSWHWQPDAIFEHMKSEIYCHGVSIYLLYLMYNM